MTETRRPLKIAFLSHEFGHGGTDRVTAHLARGFAEHGWAAGLIVLFGAPPTAAPVPDLLGPDVAVRVLEAARGSRKLDRMLILPRLVANLRESAPDVVFSTGNNMNWVTALAFRLARLGRARLVLKMTNPLVRPKDGPVRRFVRRIRYGLVFDCADAVLTLSDGEADLLRRTFPRAAAKITSAINPYVTPAMLALPAQTDRPRNIVLSIGRLAPQKRYDLLIRAFAQVREPLARLVILGEGPERRSLEALVQELGLDSRVSMPGYAPDIGPWLRRARLFARSSRYEGLPAVVLEAMAGNCPVVTTDCFILARELVGGGEGCFVVPDATPAALARAIDAAWSLDRPSSLRTIAERFGIKEGIRSHVGIVEGLLRRSAR